MKRIGILILFSALPALAGAGIDASLRATSISQASQELCLRIAGEAGDPLSARKGCELAAQAYLAGKTAPCAADSLRALQLELAPHLCLKSPSFVDRPGEKSAVKADCYRTVATYFGLRENPDPCERFGSGAGPCYRKKLDAEREKARDQAMASGMVAWIKNLFGPSDAAEGCPSVPSAAITESTQAKPALPSGSSAPAEQSPRATGSRLR